MKSSCVQVGVHALACPGAAQGRLGGLPKQSFDLAQVRQLEENKKTFRAFLGQLSGLIAVSAYVSVVGRTMLFPQAM